MIDTHCHINDEAYCNDPQSYINDSILHSVSTFVVPGFDAKSSRIAVEIAEKYENCYAAVGIHPSEVNKATEEDFLLIEKLAKSNKVIAIGEIGLDYYWEKDQKIREYQKEIFIKQIELANKLNLPILIHCREAAQDCLNLLKNNEVKRGGIMHCYAGSVEMASDFIKLRFLIGIGGTVTFKNSVTPKEVAKKIPYNSYVLETDAPYLAPDPFRGKPNHSKYLEIIRSKIAELRDISSDQVEKETTENFKRVFIK